MIDATKLLSRPNRKATGLFLLGLIVSYPLVSGETPTQVACRAALLLGASLLTATGYEIVRDWRAILRPDVVAFLALYFLTFFEFLLPQPAVDQMVTARSMHHACTLAFLAFGSMAIGRHFAPRAPKFLEELVQRPTPPLVLLMIFVLSFFLGTFYMLLAVQFDVVAMINYMIGPRFTQPWDRGRYGNARALLNELGAMINLVPPIAGMVLSRREKYGPLTWAPVALVYGFCLFMAVAGGTRHVLAFYLVTFIVAYGLNLTRKRLMEFGLFCLCAMVGFYMSSTLMLESRIIGLKAYWEEKAQARSLPQIDLVESEPQGFFVDLNLVNVAQLSDVFPSTHQFLGFEIPYLALIHPIPRALWPGKPEGLSLSLEDALGYGEEVTISATYIGEAYVAGGALGVMLAGLLFGATTSWWGRFAVGLSSGLGLLIYASGFAAIAISMRSLLFFGTAILPTMGAIVLAILFTRKPAPKRLPEVFGSEFRPRLGHRNTDGAFDSP